MSHIRAVESYTHVKAKERLACWLREAARRTPANLNADFADFLWRPNRGAPHFGVWTEYPICLDGRGAVPVWDEISEKYEAAPPTYDEMCAKNDRPAVIIDVAVQHKGAIVAAFEVVHKHATDWMKAYFLGDQGIELYEVPAHWILERSPPKFGITQFRIGNWRQIPVRSVGCGA